MVETRSQSQQSSKKCIKNMDHVMKASYTLRPRPTAEACIQKNSYFLRPRPAKATATHSYNLRARNYPCKHSCLI